jgi:glycosyltransferase involved in cell wall biosynthesis
VSILVLETVAEGPATVTPDPLVALEFASRWPRRFRSALPAVLTGLLRAIRRSDVVVSGSEVGFGMILGLPLARLTRRPFVVLVHSDVQRAVEQWRPARLRPALRAAHRRADLAVCLSPGLADGVVANGLAQERVKVMDVGIDVDDVVRRGRVVVRAADAPATGRPVVVAAGRLSYEKGFDLLVRAHAEVRGRGIDHALRIIGDGPARDQLVALATSLGVADTVELTGFLKDPQPWIASADLFVLSSRYEGTGGLVLFEAMAHRVPIVATDCETGPRRVLLDGALGALVPVEDVEAMSTAIAGHLLDPGALRARAQGGPRRARDFDAGRAAAQLRTMVEALAEGLPPEFIQPEPRSVKASASSFPNTPRIPAPAVVHLDRDQDQRQDRDETLTSR